MPSSTSKHNTIHSASHATLVDGPVLRQLYSMAMPIMFGLLALMAFNVVDTWFVAQLGEIPLAALSFAFPALMLVTSVAIGMGAGTASAVAHAMGRGDQQRARRITSDALLLALLLSIALSLAGLLTIGPVFSLMGARGDVLHEVTRFMQVWYLGAPLLIISLTGMGALRAIGDSRFQGRNMMAAALLNGLLDPLLIFGLAGFPRMEIQGAALATVLARLVTLLTALAYMRLKSRLLVMPSLDTRRLGEEWRIVLKVGLPAMLNNMIIPLSSAIVVSLVAQFGNAAVAGLGVATRVEPLLMIAYFALSSVMGPFCGQNLGASRPERILQAVNIALVFCLTGGAVLVLMMAIGSEWLAGLFSDNPEVVAVASDYLKIVSLGFGASGLVMAFNSSFNGMVKPLPALTLTVLRVLVVFLPLAFLGRWLWGLNGLFVATVLSNILVALGGYFWIRLTIRQIAG